MRERRGRCRLRVWMLTLVLALMLAMGAHAAESPPEEPWFGPWHRWGWTADYGKEGLFVRSDDGRFLFHPEFRFQTRFSYPFDEDSRTVDQLENPPGAQFQLRRSRFKVKGHLFTKWLKYNVENQLKDPKLLTADVNIAPFEEIRFQIGQWKPEYNRERRDSSGRQQFVERSIINYLITIDRQPGLMFHGRLFPRKRYDLSWWTGVFTGTGRGDLENDGGRPMSMLRLQWNVFGEVLPFSQCDLEWRETPAAGLAVAYAHNRSRYTRWSGDGGGELDGFEPGEVDQYELNQAMMDFAIHWHGWSLQTEGHWKRIDDRVNHEITDMWAGYLETGFFPGAVWHWFPKALECGLRGAALDPDVHEGDDDRQEISIVTNWFFNGHRNKITVDGSWLRVDDSQGAGTGLRVRAQWDISF